MSNRSVDVRPYTGQFYKGNRIPLAFALLRGLVETAGLLMISWLLQMIPDLISGCDIGFTLGELTVIAVGGITCYVLLSLLLYRAKPLFITRGISQYKQYVFSEITRKNIAAFSGESSSTYISALTNDIQSIEQGYLNNLFIIVENALLFVGGLTMMLWYSPLLTLIAILLSLLPVVASILTGNSVAAAENRVSNENEIYTSTIKDSLGGFSVIKSFKAEAQIVRQFANRIRQLSKAQNHRKKLKELVDIFGAITGIIAQLGVFLFGAYLSLSGKGVTAGTVIVFVQLMNFVLSPIGTIPGALAERKAARTLVQKIASALQENVREEVASEQQPLTHGITLQDVCFGYEQDKPVLRNVSCCFELGKRYVIVGASGSGKSTLLNLLMASYQNYDGTICYDDTELRHISSENLYELQSIIQQNVFVFNTNIKDNITMFRNFPDADVDRAIRLSGLSGLIEQKGLDYACGENGSGLSGGEKQRISIARSLLKKSQVLLVDEATAALDAETAYQVSSAILNLDGITRIVVTHALDEGLLRQYDSILTLKNGAIVEQGTFDELIAQKGYFYSLFTVSQ